jgi:hypothetical protein
VYPVNDGSACPVLSETQACNTQACSPSTTASDPYSTATGLTSKTTRKFTPSFGYSESGSSSSIAGLSPAGFAGVIVAVVAAVALVAVVVVRKNHASATLTDASTTSRRSSQSSTSQNPLYAGIARDFVDEEQTMGLDAYSRSAEQ